MNITLTSNRQQTMTRRIPSFLDVTAWEARRFLASRSNRRLILLALALFLLLMWLQKYPSSGGISSSNVNGGPEFSFAFQVSGTTAWGLVVKLFAPFTSLLALLLPFMNARGVAHDVKDRTHELLMSTPVPTWAYVTGRFLFCLLASLGLALLLLASVLLMGLVLHLTQKDYLPPQVNFALTLWLIVILPSTMLLSSLSFALGTLLSRYANLAPLGIIVLWFIVYVELPLRTPPGFVLPLWYRTWEPTNFGMAGILQQPYSQRLQTILSRLGENSQITPDSLRQFFTSFQSLQQTTPDLLPWLAPHLIQLGVGLVFVLIVVLTFKRSRSILN
jgi:ABC-type transport system involved in multi-copper enzyme maturation permease subunit